MYRITMIIAVLLALAGCKAAATEPTQDGAATPSAEAPQAEPAAPAKKANPSRVDGAGARELVKNGATLLDVRTPGEFSSGHIEGAKLIPVQELGGRVEEVGPKDKPVVVYCRSGARSSAAAAMLAKAGYEVHDLGGMGNW